MRVFFLWIFNCFISIYRKRLFFPPLNYLGTFDENWLFMCACIFVFYTFVLIDMYILTPMPHFHNYCSFIIKIWKPVEYIIHMYFSKLLVILGLLISIYILDSACQFVKKPAITWLGLHQIYISIWWKLMC